MRALAVGCCLLTLLACAAPARAHWRPGIPHHNASHAVRLAWCGNDRTWCYSARQAWEIARCETGGTFDVWAGYGRHDHWGLYQFGSWARAHYGFGWDPWKQSRAAHRYWLDDGWQPWTCAYLLGIL